MPPSRTLLSVWPFVGCATHFQSARWVFSDRLDDSRRLSQSRWIQRSLSERAGMKEADMGYRSVGDIDGRAAFIDGDDFYDVAAVVWSPLSEPLGSDWVKRSSWRP